MIKTRSLSLALCLALALSLCAPAARAEGEAASFDVSLSPPALALAVGSQQTLTARLTLPTGVLEGDVTLDWSIDDPGVATVEPIPGSLQATVTPVSVGAVTDIRITATAAGKGPDGGDLVATATCPTTVQYDAVTSLTLTRTTALIEAGKALELGAVVAPATADAEDVSWESSNPQAVTLSPVSRVSTTIVTAVEPGEAIITATAGARTAQCYVTVPGIVLKPTTLALTSGATAPIDRSVYGVTGATVEWSSNREDIAQVSTSGVVTARNEGTAVITASVKGTTYSASCTVTVKENTAGLITASASAGMPLPFSSLASELSNQCSAVLGSQLSYVTGLSVSTSDGILYYGYASADDPGAGVGSSEKYYYTGGGLGAMSLDNVCFVPSADFSGTSTDISYTGYSSSGRFFKGVIRVTVERTNTINYSTSGVNPARFQATDFNSICRSRNGRDVDYVTFSLPLSSKGTLYYNYTGSSLDTKVTDQTRYYRGGSPSLDSVSFVPAEGFTGSVTLQYTARDTMGYSFVGRVTVTVSNAGSGRGDISYSTDKGEHVTFKVADFTGICRDATGETLRYVRFDLPDSSKGTLYYGYSSSSGDYDSKVSDSRNYYPSTSPVISRVSFVPAYSYTGAVEVDFTGWTTEGTRFAGVVSIMVGSSGADVDVNYSTAKGAPVTFDADTFNSLCRGATGYALNYVRFELPASGQGVLYYNYTSANSTGSKVSASKNYYVDSDPYLDNVTFKPASNFVGTVSIDFTGWDVEGGRFTGTIYVKVGGSSGGGGSLDYSIGRNKNLTFSNSDFNDLSLSETGYSLKYVRFDLPDSSQGTLYYRYTSSGSYDSRVSSSTSYYRGSSPYLSSVTFVPKAGYSGKVEIGFMAWDTNGNEFPGAVYITVGSGSSVDLAYSVASGRSVTFNDSDFNDLCQSENGTNLSYVRFSLPSSAQGTLYYNYVSSNTYDSKVTESRSYYRSSSPYLSSVTFVPAAGYTGRVEIDFTAWDTRSNTFSGVVEITVKPGPAAPVISYSTGTAPVTFDASDFQTACRAREGGSFVSAVFVLPDETAGKLYYDYRGANSKGTAVSSLLAYAPSGNLLLSKVSFVPKAGYSGTVSIGYTGRDSQGESYSGTIQVVVAPPASSTHFGDMGKYAWAVPAVEYLYANNILAGLADRSYRPGDDITRGDFVLMLCRALDLSASGGAGFRDISGQYYADAVLTAQALGIAQGDGAYFYPERSLTRQDASAFLYRALRVAGWSIPDGNSGYLSAFPDRASVADYAAAPMSSMVELGILQGDEAGRLVPAKALNRAEMAVILHRVMTM